MSTEAQRRAARDFWNSPLAATAARLLDWAAAITLTLALLILGSLNL